MAQHVFCTENSIKVQYGYGLNESGVITLEISRTDSPDHYRAVLSKDIETVYDREISSVDIEAFHYIGVPKVDNNLLCAAYIASLWNHRMLYLMYGDGDGTMYKAAVAICNAVVSSCYDYHRLGFLPMA